MQIMRPNFIPGGKWTINANGTKGELYVNVDGLGGFTGGVLGPYDIHAVWREGTVSCSFIRPGQYYSGKLTAPLPLDPTPVNAVYTLAGTLVDEKAVTLTGTAQQAVIP